MSALDHQAETIKLARVLGVAPDALADLAVLDWRTLRALREQLSDTFFDDTRPMLQRAVKASRLLPVGLVAKVGERVFGPVLCAKMAGLMEPARAIEVASRMPDVFLADVSALIDPRRARAVIAGMPPPRVVAVARILADRGDYVTLARFVGYLAESTIQAVVDAVPDDEALLRTAFFLESKDTLDRLVGLVSPERLRAVVALVARDEADLWAEALALLSHVGEGWQRTIGDLAAAQDERAIARMMHVTHRLALWPTVLPIVARMSEVSQQRLLKIPDAFTPGVVRAIVLATDAATLWSSLLPIVQYMADEMRRHVAREIEGLGGPIFQRILAAGTHHVWPGLSAIALHLSEAARAELGALLRQVGAEGLEAPRAS